MIYEKTLEVQSDSDDDLSAVTLMSTEVDNISIGIQNAHETWASPIELAIAIYLLEREVIWAAAIPAAISLTVFYLTGLISKSFPARQATWMQAVRERVAFTSNWLDMSKAVKMLGISEPVSRIAQQLRVRELNLQKKFRRSFVTMNLVGRLSLVSKLDKVKSIMLFSRNILTRTHSWHTIEPWPCYHACCLYRSRILDRPRSAHWIPNFCDTLHHRFR